MPLTTPDFSVSQNLSDPSEITLTDTSAGSDTAITARRVYITIPNGTKLVTSGTTTDYTNWLYSTSTAILKLLARSIATTVRIDWVDTTGAILYTKSKVFLFALHDDLFSYELLKKEAANPSLINDSSYYSSMIKFMSDLEHAKNAITWASDSAAAQSALDRNYNKIIHASKYF